jgi:deoxyribodipyrimidine photolyase-related protein
MNQRTENKITLIESEKEKGSYEKLALVPGNCLFPSFIALKPDRKTLFFMAEDPGLCTRYAFHKYKLVLVLSAMRSYRDWLSGQHDLIYWELPKGEENLFKGKLEEKKSLSYEEKLKDVLEDYSIRRIISYEIEYSFFRERIIDFCRQNDIELEIVDSPGFLTSVGTFREYRRNRKKLRFNDFYIWQRKRLSVLLTEDELPMGGKWNFDRENRDPLPKNFKIPKVRAAPRTQYTEDVITLVEALFPSNPGKASNFYLPTTRKDALVWFDTFLKDRFFFFGPYQDALAKEEPFLFHSVLSALMNFGLLTPKEVIEKVIEYYENTEDRPDEGKSGERSFPFSSLEGFVRQVLGWREFMRGMYRTSEIKGNFFRHERRLDSRWYTGKLGIEPVDRTIRQVLEYGYAHHIQRLMVLGNFMLLCELHPDEVYRWFMELFVDSTDWVMIPNVYGMSQYADGGTFATKPYISGSAYLLKMGDYEKGEWGEIWDALFWNFVDNKREFLLKNYRTAMLISTWDRMPEDKRKRLREIATSFLEKM